MATINATGTGTTNGTSGNDTINGTAGADNVYGGDGDDIAYGGDGNDNLRGAAGDDTLFGGVGNDQLDGGTGADEMTGGVGNDSYIVDDLGDLIIEVDGEGTDTVKSYISWTLGSALENLTLVGTAAIDGYGNSLNNTIKGNGFSNNLYGGGGNDSLDGGEGDDVIVGGTGDDWMKGGGGADEFVFGSGDFGSFGSTDKIMDLDFDGGDGLTLAGFGPGGTDLTINSYDDLVRALDEGLEGWVVRRDVAGAVNLVLEGSDKRSMVIAITDADAGETAWSKFVAADALPVANADGTSVVENYSVEIDVLANDIGSKLTLVSADSTYGLVGIADNKLQFTATGDDFDSLADGETAVVTLDYGMETGAGRAAQGTVTVTVIGVNDAAEIGGKDSATMGENSVGLAAGDLTINDKDHDQNLFQAAILVGNYGVLTMGPNGGWVYVLNHFDGDLDTLNEGETGYDDFTIESVDGTEHVISIGIEGTNEIPSQPSAHNGGGDPNNNNGVTGGGVLYSTLNNSQLSGSNILYGTTGADTINARAGTDTVYGWGGDDVIDGAAGIDTIYGGSGDDEISGGAESDSLYGGSGRDTISGNANADLIVGGYGADTLTGNAGADTFAFFDVKDTNDTITDFNPGTDVIDLSSFKVDGVDFDFDAPTQSRTFGDGKNLIWFISGFDTIILGNTDDDPNTAEFMITLNGWHNLDAGDFLL